jgi:nickel-dependent lactate racemase
MLAGIGSRDGKLTDEQIESVVREGTPESLFKGKKVLVLTPDSTRTSPLPMMVRLLRRVLGEKTKRLDFMIANGTHRQMTEEEILKLYGMTANEKRNQFKDNLFLNHEWIHKDTFVKIGVLDSSEIATMTDGLFKESMEITINKRIYDYDLILILGPVFPHEVVGFSGGNKYLFPGISGGEFLDFFHWLASVATSDNVIGFKYTNVRRIVDRAAAFVSVPKHNISMVVRLDNSLAGVYVGKPEEAWSAAADLSAETHVVYNKHPFKKVIGIAPEMYDEMWVGGKVMYKLQPVVEDGGELMIYAPHIKQLSYTWGEQLRKSGYHVAEYFLKQRDAFRQVPRIALSHAVLVKGRGTFENGIEKPRINVVLATSIPEEECKLVNLGYVDWRTVDIESQRNRQHEGTLVVDHAGETLYRLESDRVGKKGVEEVIARTAV